MNRYFSESLHFIAYYLSDEDCCHLSQRIAGHTFAFSHCLLVHFIHKFSNYFYLEGREMCAKCRN